MKFQEAYELWQQKILCQGCRVRLKVDYVNKETKEKEALFLTMTVDTIAVFKGKRKEVAVHGVPDGRSVSVGFLNVHIIEVL